MRMMQEFPLICVMKLSVDSVKTKQRWMTF
jgi:hypothetical protein